LLDLRSGSRFVSSNYAGSTEVVLEIDVLPSAATSAAALVPHSFRFLFCCLASFLPSPLYSVLKVHPLAPSQKPNLNTQHPFKY
jgi:hypothetical protein